MTGRYEIAVSFDGYYSFGLYVGTGRPLLAGGDHSTLPLCRKGIASVRLNADAPLEDLTLPVEDGDEGVPLRARLRCPKFTLECGGDGMYRLTLYAKNGKPVAVSPPDATPDAAIAVLEAIRRVAMDARTAEPSGPR